MKEAELNASAFFILGLMVIASDFWGAKQSQQPIIANEMKQSQSMSHDNASGRSRGDLNRMMRSPWVLQTPVMTGD